MEPNADTPPPGSSESFNDFKDRIVEAMTGHFVDNDNQNTVMVTHSKPIGAFKEWEHYGFTDTDQLPGGTVYEKYRCDPPGGHEEVSLPQHVLNQVKDFFTGPMNPDADPINRLARQAENLRGQILDMPAHIAEHPEDIVGPGELGMFKSGGNIWASRILDARIKGVLSSDSSKEAQMRAAKEFGISEEEMNNRVEAIRQSDPHRYGKPKTLETEDQGIFNPAFGERTGRGSGTHERNTEGARQANINKSFLTRGDFPIKGGELDNLDKEISERWQDKGMTVNDIVKDLIKDYPDINKNKVIGKIDRMRRRLKPSSEE